MNLSRGSAVVALICASLPLAIACGSVSTDDLFSPSGGATQSAGANGAHAGASAAGADEGGGSSVAGASVAGGGTVGEAGDGNGGTGAVSGGGGAEPVAGSPGGGSSGEAMGGSSGEPMGGAAGSISGMGGASAGAAGTSAGSGGGGGALTCPQSAPSDESPCAATTPDSCFYTGNACSCLPSNQGPSGTKRWDCFGTPASCPTVKPTVGLSCKQYPNAECPFPGEQFCACVGSFQNATWQCGSPAAVCSQTKPNEGQACSTVRNCGYGGGVECFCNGANWHCLGG